MGAQDTINRGRQASEKLDSGATIKKRYQGKKASSAVYPIVGDAHMKASCIQTVNRALYSLDDDVQWEVVVRPLQQHKTLRQLGALFGLWKRNISDQTGESIEEIHERLKSTFLVDIYMSDPMTDQQLMWVELMILKHERDDQKGLINTRRNISLSWSTKAQMTEYIRRIHEHCMSVGIALEDTYKMRGLNYGH